MNNVKDVPPAGDVEVLAWMYQRKGAEILGPLVAVETEEMKRIREGIRYKGRNLSSPRSDYFDWRPLVDIAHVTKLQAENESLKEKIRELVNKGEITREI